MMEPENKYLVIEMEDVETSLSEGEYEVFALLIKKIKKGREHRGRLREEPYAVMKLTGSCFPEIMRSMQQESR